MKACLIALSKLMKICCVRRIRSVFWILNLTHRIFSCEGPETKTIWVDGGCCELLSHADLERNRADAKRWNEWWFDSLGMQTHSHCLQPQPLYLSLIQHFQLEIVKITQNFWLNLGAGSYIMALSLSPLFKIILLCLQPYHRLPQLICFAFQLLSLKAWGKRFEKIDCKWFFLFLHHAFLAFETNCTGYTYIAPIYWSIDFSCVLTFLSSFLDQNKFNIHHQKS